MLRLCFTAVVTGLSDLAGELIRFKKEKRAVMSYQPLISNNYHIVIVSKAFAAFDKAI